jgi:large subunit ribosomal protein L17
MCIIELVDFNELMLKDAAPAKKTTRRSRRSTGGDATAPAALKAAKVEAAPAPVVEAVEEAPIAEAEVVEETTPVAEVVEETTPVAEAASEEAAAPEASEESETEEK